MKVYVESGDCREMYNVASLNIEAITEDFLRKYFEMYFGDEDTAISDHIHISELGYPSDRSKDFELLELDLSDSDRYNNDLFVNTDERAKQLGYELEWEE